MSFKNSYDKIELLILEARREISKVMEERFEDLKTNPELLSCLQETDAELKELLEDYRLGTRKANQVISSLSGIIHRAARIREALEEQAKQNSPKLNRFARWIIELLRHVWKSIAQ